jgi:hypothetical protein
MKKGQLVKISEYAYVVLRDLGEKRFRAAKGIKEDAPIRKLALLENDIAGVCAEYAFSKMANVFPTSLFEVRNRFDKGYSDCGDLVLGMGELNVDVKSINKDYKKLKVPEHLNGRGIDIFVLMCGVDKYWEFMGAYPAANVFSHHRYDSQHSCYNVLRNELLDLDECIVMTEALNA